MLRFRLISAMLLFAALSGFLLNGAVAGPPEKSVEKPAASAGRLTAQQVAEGWVRLFDGETFFGWKSSQEDINWKVANGVISADKGPIGLLVTNTEFADYELLCDYRLEKGGNSGIFLRTLFDPKNPVTDCYELNTCDSHPAFPTGSLVGVVKPDGKVEGEGSWKTFHVKIVGNQIDVWLDGKQILSHTDKRPNARRRGFIGLQKNAGRAEFKNVFLKPLNTKPVFNGKDLTGWRTVPGNLAAFDVQQGMIHVHKGKGFLESEGTWGDFVLQADVRTNGPDLNSGIFFRSMVGTEKDPANGYELQVSNQLKEGDRSKPSDFGTGAIYRRVAARRVVSNDREWCTLTLVATGPHFATWVNGEQVVDFIDVRKSNENPRKGLRVKAGHFILQSHDADTNVDFKNLRAAEFPSGSEEKKEH